jgi:hypothetical protein
MARWLKQIGQFLLDPFLPAKALNGSPLVPQQVVIDSEQVALSKEIFDQAESRRAAVEEKARSIFATVTLLAPLLGSAFLFLIQQSALRAGLRDIALGFAAFAAALLIVAFISVVRALAVKGAEGPFLDAVVDVGGAYQFRKYEAWRRALLYLHCAWANEQENDRAAQFVKGAHILTTLAVFFYLVAATVVGFAQVTADAEPTSVKVAAPIQVQSDDLSAIRASLGRLEGAIAGLSQKAASADAFDAIRLEVQKLEQKVQAIEKLLPQKVKTPK